MKENTFEKAISIKDNINHISEVIGFLKGIVCSKLSAAIWESGFVAHSNHVILREKELIVTIKSLEIERDRLIQQFENL